MNATNATNPTNATNVGERRNARPFATSSRRGSARAAEDRGRVLLLLLVSSDVHETRS